MFSYKWITTQYYLDQHDEIQEAKIPYWQHLPIVNYNSNNFYFLINNFFNDNKNINSLNINSFVSTNIKNYSDLKEEKNLIPSKYTYNLNEESFFTEYLYLRNSSFINFFLNNLIDVPVCFKKSTSLKTKNFELPLLKFSNFLMKKGKKEKIFKILFTTFRIFFKKFKDQKLIVNGEQFSWFQLYLFTINIMWKYESNDKIKSIFDNDINMLLMYNNTFNNNYKTINTSFFIKNYFFSLLSKVAPIFSYFIYSVDKNIRKYSRGKSGKYTFIWKYVAPYKRIKLAMRWIVKDIKFFQNKQFETRLLSTFENLTNSPEKSFAWKSKIFSHNYVFKNFRKSLMTSLRTTS